MTLRQLGVSDVNMEEGSLRCDANVSIRPAGTRELGTKTELKNMNSFRFLERGISAEIARQERRCSRRARRSCRRRCTSIRAPERSRSLRSKEEAHDYRYFPEPDLVPLAPTEEMLEAARAALPELPAERAERYERDWACRRTPRGCSPPRRSCGDYFEAAPSAADGADGRAAGQLGRASSSRASTPRPTRPRRRSRRRRWRKLVGPGAARSTVTPAPAARCSTGSSPRAATRPRSSSARASARWAAATSSPAIVAAAIAANPDVAERVRGGNTKAMGAIVGHVMRETKGRADGGEVSRLVREQLGV